MSIAAKLAELTQIRADIRTALTGKGVSASEHDFADFESDITSIQTGGDSGDAYVYPYVNGSLNGHVKLYQAGKSVRSLQGVNPAYDTSNPPSYTVPTFQDITGWSYSSLGYGVKSYNTSQARDSGINSLKNVSPFNRLKPYISTEAEQEFDATDYVIDGSTDFEVTSSAAQNVGNVTFTITYTPSADITVKSFKIYKTIMIFGNADKTVLYMAIYLDEPLLLTANTSATITLELSAYAH